LWLGDKPEAYTWHSRVMAGRGIKCPHINSISDFNQADVQRAKEVSIIIIVFIFHLSNFGYIPRDVEIVKYSHIREHKT